MKLGVSYIVYDGIELLPFAIKQIRSHVDFIHVNYQKISWFGKSLSYNIEDILKDLKSDGLIDHYTEYKNFNTIKWKKKEDSQKSKLFEREKRLQSMRILKNHNCSHFMVSDVDEFYKETEFVRAKNKVLKNNWDITYCKILDYVNKPFLIKGIQNSIHIPFICKLKSLDQVFFPVSVDPTRTVHKSFNFYGFLEEELLMHHMETVRLDLKSKYESTSRFHLDRNRITELTDKINKISEGHSTFSKIIYPGLDKFSVTKVDNYFCVDFNWMNKYAKF